MFLEGMKYSFSRFPFAWKDFSVILEIIDVPNIKRSKPRGTDGGPTMLESFVVNKDESDGDDIVMNEDGTMYAAGT